MFME